MNDPVVRRVNALITTFLDMLGILLFAAATGWAGWVHLDPWAGLMAAGAVVTLLSFVAQQRTTTRAPATLEPDEKELPGPTSPGNLHVMGK